MRIGMVCPNDDCQAEYEVEVTITGQHRPATRWEPEEWPDEDITGPEVCAVCGEELATNAAFDTAMQKFYDAAEDARLNEAHDRRWDR